MARGDGVNDGGEGQVVSCQELVVETAGGPDERGIGVNDFCVIAPIAGVLTWSPRRRRRWAHGCRRQLMRHVLHAGPRCRKPGTPRTSDR